MAIVKTIISGTAVVQIDDSCYAGLSRAEQERRWAEVDRAIWSVNRNHARRMAEAEGRTSSVTSRGGATPSP